MKGTSEVFRCRHDDNGCSVSVKRSLVLCQGLAGPWYAQREHGAVGTRVSDSVVQGFR